MRFYIYIYDIATVNGVYVHQLSYFLGAHVVGNVWQCQGNA